MIRGRNIEKRAPAKVFGFSPIIAVPNANHTSIASVSMASAIPLGSNLLDDNTTGVVSGSFQNQATQSAAFRWPWCIYFREEDGANMLTDNLNTTLRVTGITAMGTQHTEDIVFVAGDGISEHETLHPYAVLHEIELVASNFVSNRNIRIGFGSDIRSSGQGTRISSGCMFKDGTELMRVSTTDAATPLHPIPRAFTVNSGATATRHSDVPYGTFTLASALYPLTGAVTIRGRAFLDITKV